MVEKKNKVVGIEDIGDIEDFFHKDFANLIPKMDFEVVAGKVSKAWAKTNYFVVLHVIEY